MNSELAINQNNNIPLVLSQNNFLGNFMSFPVEIMVQIFSSLDLYSMSLPLVVCKDFNKLYKDSSIVELHLKNELGKVNSLHVDKIEKIITQLQRKFKKNIPYDKIFSHCPQLKGLDFSRSTCIVSRVIDIAKKYCSLETLDLSFCKSSNGELDLRGLTSLKSLHCPQSSVTKLLGLNEVINLEYLDLCDTKITNLCGLDELKNLKLINLTFTGIEKLPSLKQLTALDVIDISKTNIRELPDLRKDCRVIVQ